MTNIQSIYDSLQSVNDKYFDLILFQHKCVPFCPFSSHEPQTSSCPTTPQHQHSTFHTIHSPQPLPGGVEAVRGKWEHRPRTTTSGQTIVNMNVDSGAYQSGNQYKTYHTISCQGILSTCRIIRVLMACLATGT